MTHEERLKKAAAAIAAVIPSDEVCTIMLIVASPPADGTGQQPQISVGANTTNTGKKILLRNVLQMYQHGQMGPETPKTDA